MNKPTHQFDKYNNAIPANLRTAEDNNKIRKAQERFERRIARYNQFQAKQEK